MMEIKTYATTAEELKIYNFRVDFNHEGSAIVAGPDHDSAGSASAEIDALAKQRILDNPTANLSYAQAVKDVLDSRTDLLANYCAEMAQPRIYQQPAPVVRQSAPNDPSVKVHEKALQIQQDESCANYATAVHMALDRDPALARVYADWSGVIR